MDQQSRVVRRTWRKLVKKLQRKRKRQKIAVERDRKIEKENAAKLADPSYQQWLKQQQELEDFKQQREERQHEDDELAWLRREAIAQRQFRLDRLKRQQEENAAEELRLQQAKELEAREEEQRKKRVERAKLEMEAAAEFEKTMQRMQKYLESVEMKPPKELLRLVETRPGKKLCEFFERTNSCMYGLTCQCNHRRPMLSKILLIRHFFKHRLLQELDKYKEYNDADECLELSEHDLREDYDAFFADVTVELQQFGEIINFRTVRNVLEHLRGHVFVEYRDERAALKAFINLQGRYYAAKRLNAEFSNLKSWRGAVCGMCKRACTQTLNSFKGLSLKRQCPKGYYCGYLHLFRNPGNKYNSQLDDTLHSSRRVAQTSVYNISSWQDLDYKNRPDDGAHNWRWSESPELNINSGKLTADSKDLNGNKSNSPSQQDVQIKTLTRKHSAESSGKFSSTKEHSSKRRRLKSSADFSSIRSEIHSRHRSSSRHRKHHKRFRRKASFERSTKRKRSKSHTGSSNVNSADRNEHRSRSKHRRHHKHCHERRNRHSHSNEKI